MPMAKDIELPEVVIKGRPEFGHDNSGGILYSGGYVAGFMAGESPDWKDDLGIILRISGAAMLMGHEPGKIDYDMQKYMFGLTKGLIDGRASRAKNEEEAKKK